MMTQDNFRITDTGSYLLAEFFGEFSVEAGKQCIDNIVEASVKHSRPKVLMDCRRISGDMPVFDRYQVAEYGASKRFQLRQFALLNRKEVVLPDNFVENVAVNRGMNMKVFTDYDAAVSWLAQ